MENTFNELEKTLWTAGCLTKKLENGMEGDEVDFFDDLNSRIVRLSIDLASYAEKKAKK